MFGDKGSKRYPHGLVWFRFFERKTQQQRISALETKWVYVATVYRACGRYCSPAGSMHSQIIQTVSLLRLVCFNVRVVVMSVHKVALLRA